VAWGRQKGSHKALALTRGCVGGAAQFKGTVRGYLASSNKHRVVYDDGDKELVNLTLESFQWLDASTTKRR
jgi:hypothetical protein